GHPGRAGSARGGGAGGVRVVGVGVRGDGHRREPCRERRRRGLPPAHAHRTRTTPRAPSSHDAVVGGRPARGPRQGRLSPVMGHHVATFWYLATDDPAAPIRAGRPSDPGFARRLLSRLFPTVTVASLGSFPLNRS